MQFGRAAPLPPRTCPRAGLAKGPTGWDPAPCVGSLGQEQLRSPPSPGQRYGADTLEGSPLLALGVMNSPQLPSPQHYPSPAGAQASPVTPGRQPGAPELLLARQTRAARNSLGSCHIRAAAALDLSPRAGQGQQRCPALPARGLPPPQDPHPGTSSRTGLEGWLDTGRQGSKSLPALDVARDPAGRRKEKGLSPKLCQAEHGFLAGKPKIVSLLRSGCRRDLIRSAAKYRGGHRTDPEQHGFGRHYQTLERQQP